MDSQEFSRQLCVWLDPLLVLEAGLRYDKERQNAITHSSVFFTSKLLDSAKDGSLFDLVSEFLEGFSIPCSLLSLLRTVADIELCENAWNWLENLRFEGNIRAIDKSDEFYLKDTILMIQERDAVADILAQPLRALVNIVGRFAQTWGELREVSEDSGTRVFLRHSAPGPLGVYIESRVARSYGFTDTDEIRMEQPAVNLRYRAVTLLGMPPIGEAVKKAAKESARFNASQTQEPVKAKPIWAPHDRTK